MQSLSELSLAEFQESLTPDQIRTSRIIHSAMAAGILSFGSAVLYLYSRTEAADPDTELISTLNLLSLVNAVVAVGSWIAGRVLFERQFSSYNLKDSLSRPMTTQEGRIIEMTAGQRCISIIRTAFIIRLALFEGSAFLGLAVSMIAALRGAAAVDPQYLFNMITAAAAIAFIGVTFPSREHFEGIFQEQFKRST